MPKVHIVTDSSARLPSPDLWDHPLLTISPTQLQVRDRVIGEDPRQPLSAYADLFDGDGPPQALPTAPDQMVRMYTELSARTNQILSLHSAPAFSPSLASARAASSQFLGRCDIQVIDSQTMSAGLGLLVATALQAAEAEMPIDDIVRLVRGMIPRLYLVFFLEDLTHLERHGLVSRSQAILGNMLGVIAFLTMEDGRLIPMEKVRNRPRALEKLVEFVAEFSSLEHIALLEPTESPNSDSHWVAEHVHELHPTTSVTHTDYGPSVATLVGTNSLGVVVLESDTDSGQG